MRGILWFMLGATLATCDAVPEAGATGETNEVAAGGFPKAGEYHIVRDVTAAGATSRYESDAPVAASTREGLEKLVAGGASLYCRDREVKIGGGSFSVRETCGGPSGDMAIDTHGTYSTDSIDVTYDRTVAGVTHRDTASYRLKDDNSG